ncbi:MAG TPA: hypothetical protein VNH64_06235, partial [Parvularculaceae bacterium]|nr:hypothetical protein [Parvularculaceae bacterium]
MDALAFKLGADVPACLVSEPVFVGGAGEILEAAPALPPLWATLVNPGVAMPTGPVFRDFDAANPTPGPPRRPDAAGIGERAAFEAYLTKTRNDLEPPAIAREKAIGAARELLAQSPGALLARMSGSGASVYGLFAAPDLADRAAARAQAQGWWAMAARIAGTRADRRTPAGDEG